MVLRYWTLLLTKKNCLLKNFLGILILMTRVLYLVTYFSSKINLKMHNILVTPKLVQKLITNLDSSSLSGLNFILVVVLRKCEPELSSVIAKLSKLCLKVPCFQDCWKVS